MNDADILATALAAGDTAEAMDAIDRLGASHDARFLPLLERQLHEIEELAIAAACAIGELQGPGVLETLQRIVSDLELDEFARREAVLALRNRGEAATIAALAADDAQGWVVQMEALGALADMDAQEALPAALQMLPRAKDPHVRAEAVPILGAVGGSAVEDALERAAEGDADRRVRRAARKALKTLRD